MSTSTRTRTLDFEDGYFVPTTTTPGGLVRRRQAETHSALAGLSRFGAFVVPIAVAAAFFAPAGPQMFRRMYSTGDETRTSVLDITWDVEEAALIESAWTSQSEIDELNRLFAISPSEGFWIEFPDA